jgi:hypothetical protein
MPEPITIASNVLSSVVTSDKVRSCVSGAPLPAPPSGDAGGVAVASTHELKIVGIGLEAAGVFWLGWWIDIPVVEWVLMIGGGFLASVVVFLLGILMFGPREETR